MHSFISALITFLTNFINEVGYLGIFIGMFLESTLVPLPSELVMIPAGLAVSSGEMNIYIALFVGVLGNVVGAVFSYYLAASIGRTILFRIGKYFFVKAETIIKIEKFFENHGPISIFIGRLLPGFRHFISLPAGVARMDMKLFLIYTTLGSTIWNSILIAVGFFIGNNHKLIAENFYVITLGLLGFCIAILLGYIFLKPTRK
jgi:membrane protein DedA with SNARE-associated domain